MADSKILQGMTNSKKKVMTPSGPTQVKQPQNYPSYLFTGTTITPCSSDLQLLVSLHDHIYYMKNNKNINSIT